MLRKRLSPDARNGAAIFFVAGRVFAGDQPEKAGNLAHVLNLAPVSQPRHGMRGRDRADARQTGEQTDGLPQFRIVLTEAANLFLHCGGGIENETASVDQPVQLKAHLARYKAALPTRRRPAPTIDRWRPGKGIPS